MILRRNVFKDLYFFKVKYQPPPRHCALWPHPIPGGHDLNEIESTLPKDDSTKVSAFLFNWFLRWFLKMPTNLK